MKIRLTEEIWKEGHSKKHGKKIKKRIDSMINSISKGQM